MKVEMGEEGSLLKNRRDKNIFVTFVEQFENAANASSARK